MENLKQRQTQTDTITQDIADVKQTIVDHLDSFEHALLSELSTMHLIKSSNEVFNISSISPETTSSKGAPLATTSRGISLPQPLMSSSHAGSTTKCSMGNTI
jgi:hypothetical protein